MEPMTESILKALGTALVALVAVVWLLGEKR